MKYTQHVVVAVIPGGTPLGCANEATTGLTLGLFVMLFQDVVFG